MHGGPKRISYSTESDELVSLSEVDVRERLVWEVGKGKALR